MVVAESDREHETDESNTRTLCNARPKMFRGVLSKLVGVGAAGYAGFQVATSSRVTAFADEEAASSTIR